MKFDSQCKAIIESLSRVELGAYKCFLIGEVNRHQDAMAYARSDCSMYRYGYELNREYARTMLKLYQTAIYRHRQDIQGTRECILRAEDRMEVLSEQG